MKKYKGRTFEDYYEHICRTVRAVSPQTTFDDFLERVLLDAATTAKKEKDAPEDWPAMQLLMTQKLRDAWDKTEKATTSN